MRKKIKITFCDFWDNFIPTDNYFFNLLSMKYDVEIDHQNPEIVFFSVYSKTHFRFDKSKVIKILYTGENYRPNYNDCHYSLSFDYLEDNRNYRLPLWALLFNWFNRPYIPERDHAYHHSLEDFTTKKKINKSRFCSFVVSNPNSYKRIEFANKLMKYKNIDCPGRVLNNMESINGRGDQKEKVEFLRDYKFNICFENSSYSGYTTEKIIHSMFMNCIPIYWGDPLVPLDFNPNSFLNSHDYLDDDKLISRIIEIDNNDKLYQDMINEPWFNNNIIPDFIKPESVLSFFEKIID